MVKLLRKDVGGKMFGVWFPIMTFVAIGFQHLVANMFAIPAAMFEGAKYLLFYNLSKTWEQYF